MCVRGRCMCASLFIHPNIYLSISNRRHIGSETNTQHAHIFSGVGEYSAEIETLRIEDRSSSSSGSFTTKSREEN